MTIFLILTSLWGPPGDKVIIRIVGTSMERCLALAKMFESDGDIKAECVPAAETGNPIASARPSRLAAQSVRSA